MRYEQIEKFISEDGDLEELIIDQEPAHEADYTFSYYYLRKGAELPIKGCILDPSHYWRKYWDHKKGKKDHDRIR